GYTIPKLVLFLQPIPCGKIHGFLYQLKEKKCFVILGVLGCLAFYHWLVAGPAKLAYPPPHRFHITIVRFQHTPGIQTRIVFRFSLFRLLRPPFPMAYAPLILSGKFLPSTCVFPKLIPKNCSS
ncbi:hypothetical protein NPIL_141571, partial [Nephila pilipes]